MRPFRLFAIPLTVTVAACARPTPPAILPAPAIALPDSIRTNAGTFRLVRTSAIEGFPTDSSFRYADSTGFYVSVFRFPIRDDVKTGADSLKWLEKEGDKFFAIQGILRSRGVIDSSVIAHRSVIPIYPQGPPVVQHVAAVQQYSRRGTMTEVEYLCIIGGRFFKIRGSEPQREEGMSPTAQFSAAIVRYMTRPR